MFFADLRRGEFRRAGVNTKVTEVERKGHEELTSPRPWVQPLCLRVNPGPKHSRTLYNSRANMKTVFRVVALSIIFCASQVLSQTQSSTTSRPVAVRAAHMLDV